MRRGKGHHALGRQRERARVRRVFWSPSPAPPPHAPPARTHLPSHPHAHARARACSPPHPHAPPLSPAPGARGHRRRGGGTVGGRPYSHVSKIRRCAGEPGCAWDVHGVGGVGGGVHGACMGAALHGGGAWGWGEGRAVQRACCMPERAPLPPCVLCLARRSVVAALHALHPACLPRLSAPTPPASHAGLEGAADERERGRGGGLQGVHPPNHRRQVGGAACAGRGGGLQGVHPLHHQRKSNPPVRACAGCTRASSTSRACTACSACPPPRPLGGCTPPPPQWPSCPRWMRWM